MGGEYYYAVEARVDDQHVPWRWVLQVAYLMAYYWDCGSGTSTPYDWFDNPHTGDSEFAIIDVSYDTVSHHWRTEDVFLSAHCGSSIAGGNCKWWSPPDFAFWVDQRVLGAPYVWVSMGKHGNYPTEGVCEGAVFGLEHCEYGAAHRFPVAYVQQNIGSRAHPFRDCDVPFSASTMADHSLVECMWSYRPNSDEPPLGRFNGWQLVVTGGLAPTPYGEILWDKAGF
jgi:hypothetical protein